MVKVILFLAILTLPAAMLAQGGPTKVTGKPTHTVSGLDYWDIKVGDGPVAKAGQSVSVHYTGWLTNGKKFDSSVEIAGSRSSSIWAQAR